MSRIVLEIHIIVKNEVKMPRFLLFKLFGIVFLNFIIFKRLRQLIWAACAVSALNAFKQSYYFVDFMSDNEAGYALRISAATVDEFNRL